MKTKLKFLIILLFVLITVIVYIYRPSTNYLERESDVYFYNLENFIDSSDNYVSKVISIKGSITDVVSGSPYISVVLDSKLHFSFESSKTQSVFLVGDTISVKGRFEGYDNLFEQYTFTDCTVIK